MDKNKFTIILAILTVVLLALNVGSCVNASNQDSLRKKEMLQRMEMEEKMSKLVQDNAISSGKLKEMQKQLDAGKDSLEVAKKAFNQEQLVTSSLKEDLQKLTKAKDALEGELKKSLASNIKVKK